MFIRAVHRNYKNTPDYYVIRHVWIDGKDKHQVVAPLGKYPDIEQARDAAIREKDRIMAKLERIEYALGEMRGGL